MGLDETKLEELRHWGEALREAPRDESVAAGRAILMLIDELERLRLRLRLQPTGEQPAARLDPMSNNAVDTGTGETTAAALHGRLQRLLGRDSDQSLEARPEEVEEASPRVELERDTAAARSWIETLRRQK
jgi:predicted DNA-binding protein (UPF0251 family)